MLKYRLGLSKAGRNGDDMSDAVSVITFPDDRRLGFNKQLDLGDTWYSSRATVAIDPIQGAIAISS